MKSLFQKYIIQKADGGEVDPEADYFVLRLNTDSTARYAAWQYARSIRRENPELAADLMARIASYGDYEYDTPLRQAIDEIWRMVAPHDGEWDYPAQVVRYVREKIRDRKED